MDSKTIKPIIKVGASGAHFVKIGNDTIGGFHNKARAELFLKAYNGELQREAYNKAIDDAMNRHSQYGDGLWAVNCDELKSLIK